MSGPPYMRLYWGDYRKGTGNLRTAQEHGAYLLLIGALWDSGGKLPADDHTLARHACCTLKEWAALKPVLLPFFRVSRGRLYHKRVTEELQKYADKIGKLKTAGKRGSQVSNGKRKRYSAANAQQKPTYSESEGSYELLHSSITTLPACAEARLDGASAPCGTEEISSIDRLIAILDAKERETLANA